MKSVTRFIGFSVNIEFGLMCFGLCFSLVSDWWKQCRARQGPSASRGPERDVEDGAEGERDEEGSGAPPRVVNRDDDESETDDEETYV